MVAVLDVLSSHGAFLIEDDWARDLSLDGEPPGPLISRDTDGHMSTSDRSRRA